MVVMAQGVSAREDARPSRPPQPPTPTPAGPADEVSSATTVLAGSPRGAGQPQLLQTLQRLVGNAALATLIAREQEAAEGKDTGEEAEGEGGAGGEPDTGVAGAGAPPAGAGDGAGAGGTPPAGGGAS